MVRPRDGHDLRILGSDLSISPTASVHWEFDVFGNSVAFAAFEEQSSELRIESTLVLERFPMDQSIAAPASEVLPYPFEYGPDELIDLSPTMRVECVDEEHALANWLQSAVPTRTDGSLALLKLLTRAIHDGFGYRRREEEGVQTPAQTLATGGGTCRDFAFLFIEAARQLGFAARFVSGYLYDPALDKDAKEGEQMSGGGATHAWAEVFVPGVGWIEFDPTNRMVAGKNLIRVATTRTPSQALPVQGSYRGDDAVALGLEVTVALTETD